MSSEKQRFQNERSEFFEGVNSSRNEKNAAAEIHAARVLSVNSWITEAKINKKNNMDVDGDNRVNRGLLIRCRRKSESERTKNANTKIFRKSTNPDWGEIPHLNTPIAEVGMSTQSVRNPKY